MDIDKPMYRWRRMSPEDRKAVLEERKGNKLPWHGPPHYVGESNLYMITAACYEHKAIIGTSIQRMSTFESELLQSLDECAQQLFAWAVLPNHYHVLVQTDDVISNLADLGRFHGKTSFEWNGEDDKRGRQVWHRAAETEMKSERHFFATLNYVLDNPRRHGYVKHWQDWPFSSAAQYLDEVGRKTAKQRWRDYPVLDYGKEWDPPEL